MGPRRIVGLHDYLGQYVHILTVKQMILSKESSVLGYPGEISMPLTADHHNVCKFTGMQDSNYRRVKSVLQTLLAKLPELSTVSSSSLLQKL